MAYYIDKEFVIQFGAHLKKVREGKGITQAQLAIDCEIDVSVISRIERGITNTSLSNIRLISKSLNISIKELFDFDQNP